MRGVLSRREPDKEVGPGGQSLTQVVQTVVRAFDDERLQPVGRSDAGPALNPKTLLALLSCCYARDIFGSADVEDALRRDVQFRDLCNGEFPDARTIRRFQRRNREALHRCLTATLRSLAEGLPFADPLSRRSDAAFAEDASRRITKAMWIDSLELED